MNGCDKMNYVGIDLAWTYKNETGLCIINDQKEIVYLEADTFTDEQIFEVVNGFGASIISVDSPLVVQNENGGRACDNLLMKTLINGHYLKLYATSRCYMLKKFGTIRGEQIYKTFIKKSGYRLGKNMVETYPTGIFLCLFPDLFDHRYKISSKLLLEELILNAQKVLKAIEGLGFTKININLEEVTTKKAYKSYEDKIDAMLCAINSFYFEKGQVTIYQCDGNGITVLPNPI